MYELLDILFVEWPCLINVSLAMSIRLLQFKTFDVSSGCCIVISTISINNPLCDGLFLVYLSVDSLDLKLTSNLRLQNETTTEKLGKYKSINISKLYMGEKYDQHQAWQNI